MRSAFAQPMRLAERTTGVLETIEATQLWEKAGPQKKNGVA